MTCVCIQATPTETPIQLHGGGEKDDDDDILSENTTYINNLTVSGSQIRKEIHTERNIYNILLQQLYLCLGYICTNRKQ